VATGNDPTNATSHNVTAYVTALAVSPVARQVSFDLPTPVTTQLTVTATLVVDAQSYDVDVTADSYGTLYSSSNPAVAGSLGNGLFQVVGPGDSVLGAQLAGLSASSLLTAYACGDGQLDPGEFCDDGGNLPGDGCDASCGFEYFSVGGQVSGLPTTALPDGDGDGFPDHAVVLGLEGEQLGVTIDGAFTFATTVAHSSSYLVTVDKEPAGRICSIEGATGVIAAADVTSVSVSCRPLPKGKRLQAALSVDAACYLDATGSLGCWGGTGLSVVDTKPAGSFIDLALGTDSGCVLGDDGLATCWGANASALAPPAVLWRDIATGINTACGVRSGDGALECWGSYTTLLNNIPPGSFNAVFLRHQTACALGTNSALSCWGDNVNTVVNLVNNAPQGQAFDFVDFGQYHACAINPAGAVECWGSTTYDKTIVPPELAGLTMVDLALGLEHSCALEDSGVAHCWGAGSAAYKQDAAPHFGQAIPPRTPDAVFEELMARKHTTCGLKRDGGMLCWGQSSLINDPPGYCGDGIVDLDEQCDDGVDPITLVPEGGDGCSADCKSNEQKGNGILDPGEVCDDGTGAAAGEFCNDSCTISTRCGDGTQTVDQVCDDKNECTAESCNDQYGCDHTPVADGTSCEDGAGSCRSGGCVVPQVSTAKIYDTACEIDLNGALSCWGQDTQNNLRSGAPVSLFKDVAMMGPSACALDVDGIAECWGLNANNLHVEPNLPFRRIAVCHGQYSNSIAACAITMGDGTLRCWGGSDDYNPPPAPPPDGQFTDIAGGNAAFCAISSAPGITCWGTDNNNIVTGAPPNDLFSRVEMGLSHACAIRTEGSLHCWGSDTYGQSTVPDLTGRTIVDVSLGDQHTCAIDSLGVAYCWGAGGPDQKTDTSPHFGQSTAPTSPDATFGSIIAGGNTTCGIKRDGGMLCWGQGSLINDPPGACGDGVVDLDEQCDDGVNPITLVPEGGDGCSADCKSNEQKGNGILDPGEVCDDGTGAAAGEFCNDSCTISTRCGDGTQTVDDLCGDKNECTAESCDDQYGCDHTPVADGTSCEDGAGSCRSGGCVVPQVSTAKKYHTACEVDLNGALRCWGQNTGYSLATGAPPGLFKDVAMMGISACALDVDGIAECWGLNSNNLFLEPNLRFRRIAVSDGQYSNYIGACAITMDDGTLRCWGSDDYSPPPAPPPDGQFTDIAGGNAAFCAISGAPGAICWGTNNSIISGAPTTDQFSRVEMGRNHACAIKTGNGLDCWGNDLYGQSSVPPAVADLTMVDVSLGDYHTCVIDDLGTAHCWGAGDPTDPNGSSPHFGQSIPPTTPDASFYDVFALLNSSCAIKNDGGMLCWGQDTLTSNPPGFCGDGNIDLDEQCDDGVDLVTGVPVGGDGCSADCKSAEYCGNGIIDPATETCDDGNTIAGDGCSDNCQSEVCGNGIIDPGEVCDDGNTVGGDGCSADCTSDETCGNNIVDPGEACDDGNTISGDGCSADCTSDESCGNGVLDPGEECDDGNTVDGDGCSSTCLITANQCDGQLAGSSCNLDDNPCTIDTCDGTGSCVTSAFLEYGASCSDGNICNGDEYCDGNGVCLGGPIPIPLPAECSSPPPPTGGR